VAVLRLALAGGDDVDVEVEDAVDGEGEVAQARLFAPLAQRRLFRIFIDLHMPAHLQPAIQPAMMVEEQPAAVNDEAARRDVAGDEVRAVEGSFGLAHEIDDGRLVPRLEGVGRAVALQLGKKIEAPHVDGYHW